MSCIFCKGSNLITLPLYSNENGASITVSNNGELTFTEGNEALTEWAVMVAKHNPRAVLPPFPNKVTHTVFIDRCPICGEKLNNIKPNKEKDYTLTCSVCGREAEKVDYKEIGRDSISTFDTTTCKCRNGKHKYAEQNNQRSQTLNDEKLYRTLKVKLAKVQGGYMWGK